MAHSEKIVMSLSLAVLVLLAMYNGATDREFMSTFKLFEFSNGTLKFSALEASVPQEGNLSKDSALRIQQLDVMWSNDEVEAYLRDYSPPPRGGTTHAVNTTHLYKLPTTPQTMEYLTNVPVFNASIYLARGRQGAKPYFIFWNAQDNNSHEANWPQFEPLLSEYLKYSFRMRPYPKDLSVPAENITEYDYGIVHWTHSCLENGWHGIMEGVMPIVATKVVMLFQRLGYAVDEIAGNGTEADLLTSDLAENVVELLYRDMLRGSHVLISRSPRRSSWGLDNKGCWSFNRYPYGHEANVISGWMGLSFFTRIDVNSTTGEITLPSTRPLNTEFWGEYAPMKRFQSTPSFAEGLLHIRKAVTAGTTGLCQYRGQDFPYTEHYPWYLSDRPICAFFYDIFRRYITRSMKLRRFDHPVPLSEARCPVITFINRQGAKSGRALVNFNETVNVIRRFLEVGGPMVDGEPLLIPGCGRLHVVRFEQLSFLEQMKIVLNTTALLGTRGMGLVYSVFLRHGAGSGVLCGHRFEHKFDWPKDNGPWHPLRSAVPANPTAIEYCPIVHPAVKLEGNLSDPGGATNARRCLHRTFNFCNMRCPASTVHNLIQQLMSMIVRRALLFSNETPSVSSIYRTYSPEDVLYIAKLPPPTVKHGRSSSSATSPRSNNAPWRAFGRPPISSKEKPPQR